MLKFNGGLALYLIFEDLCILNGLCVYKSLDLHRNICPSNIFQSLVIFMKAFYSDVE